MIERSYARRSYDALASSYDERWKKYIDASLALALEPLELAGHERVLDVGCGTGQLQRRLTERWPALRLAGVDVSANMLRQAAQKHTNAELLAAEAWRLPLADGSFDAVLCANAFHYFRRPDCSLKEIRRVLRPTGKFVLVDWCDDYWSCRLCSAWLRWTDRAFYRAYSMRQCRVRLEHHGFSVQTESRRRVGWIWGLMCLAGASFSGGS